jgi:hypothetical protein
MAEKWQKLQLFMAATDGTQLGTIRWGAFWGAFFGGGVKNR